MKRASALFGIGLVALIAQGALATLLPPPWCPDLAFLVLIGVGLRWRGLAGGLVLAALLGYATDLVSGSLLGQHALLNLLAFSGTMLASRQLNLRRAGPLAAFAGFAMLVYGFAMLMVTGFFVGGVELRWGWVGAQLIHAVSVAVFAPTVAAPVAFVSRWAGDEETSELHSLGIEPYGRMV